MGHEWSCSFYPHLTMRCHHNIGKFIMKAHIFDTHVKTANGNYYHFDVLVSDARKTQANEFALRYLDSIGINDADIKQQACDFCHSEMANPVVKQQIEATGYYIIPMQGCPAG